MSFHRNHPPCPCGAELADECPRCNSTNPLGSMRVEPAIGSRPTQRNPAPTDLADARATADSESRQ